MKFNCPNCRKEFDFMAIQLSSDLNAIIAMSDSFGHHRALVWAYAELFGIVPFHAKAKKFRLILEEMKKLFDGAGFSYQKRLYQISIEGIAEALSVVVKKNFADGLDNHNYLKRVMISISDREEKTSGRQAEKDLQKREAALMSGSRDGEDRYPVPEEQIEAPPMKLKSMPKENLAPEENLRRVQRLVKTIGFRV